MFTVIGYNRGWSGGGEFFFNFFILCLQYSFVATFFNFAKSSIGSGSFALPWGILQAGVLVGSAGMALLGIAGYVCLYASVHLA